MDETKNMWNKKRDKIFLFYIECGDGLTPSRKPDDIQIGLLSIGTFLKEKGYQIRLFTDRYPDLDELKRMISWSRVRIIGFYTATDNIYRIIEITEFIKKTFPKIIIVYGGPQATVRPLELLQESFADIIVRYEGEYTMLDLVNYYFLKEGSLENIAGITYRDGNTIKTNPDRPFIENLDDLPIIDRNLLPYKEDYPSILTGRGCPYNCTFCFQGTGHYYRMRSVANVMKELDSLLARYDDPLYIGFTDDTFIADPERTIRLCREIKKRKEFRPGFHWYAETRANILYQYPELIREMKEAGLKFMQFGIESANELILKIYKKMITPEQVEFVIKKCVEEDIFQIVVSFILGGPFETKETIEESLNFAKKLIRLSPGRLRILNGSLTPLPGTPLGDEPEKYDIIPIAPYMRVGSAGGREYLSETVKLKLWELDELKQRFSKEVVNTMNEEIHNIPVHQVEKLFTYPAEGMTSMWYNMMNNCIALRRYFNFKKHPLYKSIKELKDEELEKYFPQRTNTIYKITPDGIILDRYGKNYKLNSFETRMFQLSGGKIKFKDIVNIILEEFKNFSSPDQVREKLIKFYRELDKIYGIIFAKI